MLISFTLVAENDIESTSSEHAKLEEKYHQLGVYGLSVVNLILLTRGGFNI